MSNAYGDTGCCMPDAFSENADPYSSYDHERNPSRLGLEGPCPLDYNPCIHPHVYFTDVPFRLVLHSVSRCLIKGSSIVVDFTRAAAAAGLEASGVPNTNVFVFVGLCFSTH